MKEFESFFIDYKNFCTSSLLCMPNTHRYYSVLCSWMCRSARECVELQMVAFLPVERGPQYCPFFLVSLHFSSLGGREDSIHPASSFLASIRPAPQKEMLVSFLSTCFYAEVRVLPIPRWLWNIAAVWLKNIQSGVRSGGIIRWVETAIFLTSSQRLCHLFLQFWHIWGFIDFMIQ